MWIAFSKICVTGVSFHEQLLIMNAVRIDDLTYILYHNKLFSVYNYWYLRTPNGAYLLWWHSILSVDFKWFRKGNRLQQIHERTWRQEYNMYRCTLGYHFGGISVSNIDTGHLKARRLLVCWYLSLRNHCRLPGVSHWSWLHGNNTDYVHTTGNE